MSDGLGIGAAVSLAAIFIYAILRGSMGSFRFAERISWKWSRVFRQDHLWTGLTLMSILFLIFGLSGMPSSVQGDALDFELGWGLQSGLSISLSVGLSYLVLLGLYRGITREHLEDQSRQQFNQGIRHSLLNGLLLALISACILTTFGAGTGVLRSGLSDGLNAELTPGLVLEPSGGPANGLSMRATGSLSSELSLGMSVGLGNGLHLGLEIFATSMVIMWVLSGGLVVLRHYVIRRLLAHQHSFPWRAQAFLDDATSRILLRRVGGGYSFIHRRLQDYFATMDDSQREQ